MKPETLFRKKVTAFLKTLPHTFQMSVQQKAIVGSPDKLVCINGFFVALEIKSSTGKVSAAQAYVLDSVEKAQGISLVVAPENWELVQKILSELAEENSLPRERTRIWRQVYAQGS